MTLWLWNREKSVYACIKPWFPSLSYNLCPADLQQRDLQSSSYQRFLFLKGNSDHVSPTSVSILREGIVSDSPMNLRSLAHCLMDSGYSINVYGNESEILHAKYRCCFGYLCGVISDSKMWLFKTATVLLFMDSVGQKFEQSTAEIGCICPRCLEPWLKRFQGLE